ncbi:MAG: Fpg/Nei family DNA glycosylase, partial [Phycisphaerae bacterium]
MPELPEVETIARQLARRILGRHVTELELIRPDLIGPDGRRAAATLRGQRIVSIDRHGKRLIISLQDGAMLVFHLGMTGRLLLARSGSPLPAHTHLRVRLGSAGELRFCDPRRFGRVWIVPRGSRWTAPALTPLGPDALRISSGRFQQLCRRRRAIKALLLDQRAIAGLGN